jgi:chromosomal replication initiator protein
LQRPIDLRLAKESLADLVDDQAEAPTAEAIRDLVCRQYQVSEEDLKSKSRRKNVVLPRNLGMYLCRKMTDMSLEDIGRVFSRNHSTVLYSINATEHRSRKDPKLKGQIEFLMHKLQQNEPA